MKRLDQALAPLASLAAQKRYIVNATSDEYLLPEELLVTAINVLFEQNGIKMPESKTLEEVKVAMQACNIPEGMSGRDIVLDHKPWVRVRETSEKFLTEIGFDLKEWELNEL